ncbi:MAG TPA: acyl-CoA dehydrogenase family protein [Gemmatimonadaceae bacterium]
MSDFFQAGPALGNQYVDDALLRAYLRRTLPADVLAELEPDFQRFGERVATDILAFGEAAESQPPRHVPFDAWGRRVDAIETSDAWRALDRVAATEGLVAIGYERRHGALSRVDQFVRMYLFGPSSATYNCPLAMSDGAARALELYGSDELCTRALTRLTSRDPGRFWTSGQWMTERAGGSDVSETATVARCENGAFRLYGTKWFTSATTAQMAMTLARIEGAPAGSRGLSLFFVELHDAEGRLRNIRVNRLKDKLGTRALPTAELALEGTPAELVGGEGDGVRKIAALFNITRIHNACAAVAGMRRAIALAEDYARKRVVFGRLLADQPLHRETLAELRTEHAAALLLVFHVVELLGRSECGGASTEELALLRLLTPIAKLYTGKQAVAVASEVLEAFGGAGYIEDTGLPRLLRDAQVLSIWEGTTNVLSLDVLRAIEKDGAFAPFMAAVEERLDRVRTPSLSTLVDRVRASGQRLAVYHSDSATRDRDAEQAGARAFAYGLARTYMASLLLDHADWSVDVEGDDAPIRMAERWCARELVPRLIQ